MAMSIASSPLRLIINCLVMLAFLALTASATNVANVQFSSMLQTPGAVLQRGEWVSVTGRASGAGAVSVALDGVEAATAAVKPDGSWVAHLQPQKASWSRRLTAAAGGVAGGVAVPAMPPSPAMPWLSIPTSQSKSELKRPLARLGLGVRVGA